MDLNQHKRRRSDATAIYMNPYQHLEREKREAKRPLREAIVKLDSIFCQEVESDGGGTASTGTSSSAGASKVSRDGSSGTCEIVSATDRPKMEAYPFHLASSLELCESIFRNDRGPTRKYEMLCGIQCVGCQEKFQSFPRTRREVEKDIIKFRRHVEWCKRLPNRKYLLWMAEHGFEGDRAKYIRYLAKLIGARMDQHESDGDEKLKAAGKRKRSQQRSSVLESVGSAKPRRQLKSHSVLESAGLVEPRLRSVSA